jgi:hypothetical protein
VTFGQLAQLTKEELKQKDLLEERLRLKLLSEIKKGFNFSGILCPLKSFLELLHFEMYVKTFDLKVNIGIICDYLS